MEANEPIRKRIVINLDSPPGSPPGSPPLRSQSSARRPRRWPKVIAILLVLFLLGLIAVAGGGYFWWRHYQTTPAYSLALLIDAAQHDNLAEVEKRIDYDKVSQNMLADASQRAAGRYGVALNGLVQQQIDRVMPTVLPRLKEVVVAETVKELKDLSATAQGKPFPLVAIGVPSFVKITTEGDTANASAPVGDRNVEIQMSRDADRWKITGLKDEVLLQQVVDRAMKDLPPIGGLDPRILLKGQGRKPLRKGRR